MEKQIFISKSLPDTMSVAKNILKYLNIGDVLTLSGDLGAGKTTFTKCLAQLLNIKEDVTSPTFTFINEYLNGDMCLYHFDMYRIEDVEEAIELGVIDYFNASGKKRGLCVVEWAENIKSLLPKHKTLTIEKVDESTRKFIFEG